MGMYGVLTFMDRSTTVITIYQLRWTPRPLWQTNPKFPEDYKLTMEVNTNSPREAFAATNQEEFPPSVTLMCPDSPRSTSVGDIMVINHCAGWRRSIGLMVESVGFSYQFELQGGVMYCGH